MASRRAIVICCVSYVVTTSVAQTRIHVDAVLGVPIPPNEGDNWGTAAYKYLQDALQLATQNATSQNPYEIWVAAGTYITDESAASPNGTNSRATSFELRSNIATYGGFVGNETTRNQRNPELNATILSGEIGASALTDNAYHVVRAEDVDDTAVLDGFHIVYGQADALLGENGYGAGLHMEDSDARIVRCVIESNYAGFQAAAHMSRAVSQCS